MKDDILQHDADFRALIDGFDFTLPGKDKSLGLDLANAAAQRIQERTVHGQEDADGNALPPNSEQWTAYKRAGWQIDEIGYWTGQTLSHKALVGETTVEPARVEMIHGTDEPATEFFDGSAYPPEPRSGRRRGGGQPASDPPTDRQKLEWLEDRKGKIYAFADGDAAALSEIAAQALDEYLSGLI